MTTPEPFPPFGLSLRAPAGLTRGERREGNRYRLTAERWRALGHPRVEVDGPDDRCRRLLGAD